MQRASRAIISSWNNLLGKIRPLAIDVALAIGVALVVAATIAVSSPRFPDARPADALAYTKLMYEITLAESTAYRLPTLDFRGTPTGIDVRLVAQTGILPQIDTGMAHREPGIGQVGAGLVKPPRLCFDRALEALVRARAGAAAGSGSR